jgi:hypothetical protein
MPDFHAVSTPNCFALLPISLRTSLTRPVLPGTLAEALMLVGDSRG